MLLSLVIPCFNEEKTLYALYHRVHEVCKIYETAGYEIIFINDGSKDHTWKIIQELHQQDHHIVGLSLARNFGHAMALTAGFEASKGQRVLVIDADLQDPPELLPKMMDVLNQGADIAYGKRTKRKGETLIKRFTAYLFYRFLNVLSPITFPTDAGDFCLMRREVVNALNSMPESSRYIRGMITWTGFDQQPVYYEREERFAGKTHYTLAKMLQLGMDAITGFSNYPLRFAFYFGVFMLMLSMFFLGYVLYVYIHHRTVRGWSSLACLITGLQGFQFLVIGMIGEYVGRIYQEAKRRPKYIIAKSCRAENV